MAKANPIIIDCGGSTRIKQIVPDDVGDMPALLDVRDLPGADGVLRGTGPLPAGVRGSQQLVRPGHDLASQPFTNMTIMFQDAAGTPFSIPVPALPNSFLITSNLGQSVRGDFVQIDESEGDDENESAAEGGAEVELVITVFSSLVDPMVVAKQLRLDGAQQGRRRYVVDNAGPIKTIMLNDAAPLVYDATNAPGPPPAAPIAPGAVGPVGGPNAPAPGLPLYVSVVIS